MTGKNPAAKRLEWGYPDVSDDQVKYETDPPSSGGEWPPAPVPAGYVNKASLDKDTAASLAKADSALQSILPGTGIEIEGKNTVALTGNAQSSLAKADTALQPTSTLDGSKLAAKSVAKTALAQDVQDAIGKVPLSAKQWSGNLDENGRVIITDAAITKFDQCITFSTGPKDTEVPAAPWLYGFGGSDGDHHTFEVYFVKPDNTPITTKDAVVVNYAVF